MFRGVRCRETIKLPPTKENLRRAKLHKSAIEDAIIKGTFDYSATFPKSKRVNLFAETPVQEPCAITVAEYLHQWMERKAKELHASSINGYRKIIDNQIIPAFGSTPIGELTRPVVRQWIEAHPATNKTISNVLSPLRAALTDAVDDGFIENNPLAGWKYRKRQPPKSKRGKKKDPFSTAEQSAILGATTGQGRNLLQFLFWSGLRTSEVVALEWGDIDWIGRTAHISRAETQAADEPEDTKTNAGTRRLKLLNPALEALANQKEFTFLEGKRVFHNPRTNEPWAGDQPIRRTLWTPVLKKAGVRYRNPYQTRHTYASMMISSGEPIKWLSKQLGHSDMVTTLRTYVEWLDDADPTAGEKAVDLFSYGKINGKN